MLGLNPCCNGRWSRTRKFALRKEDDFDVLILVVMEDGLVPSQHVRYHRETLSLNPCCNGRWSRT